MHFHESLLPFQNFLNFASLPLWLSNVSLLAVLIIACYFIYNMFFKNNIQSQVKIFFKLLMVDFKKPSILFIISYILYITLELFYTTHPKIFSDALAWVTGGLLYLLRISMICSCFWLLENFLTLSQHQLQRTVDEHYPLSQIKQFLPIAGNSIRGAIFILLINIIIPSLDLTVNQEIFLEKVFSILFICALAIIFYQITNALSLYILNKYTPVTENSITVRRITTQVAILKRLILSLGAMITIAAILMVFDSVRKLGAGILTTAGILSAIGAYSSSQSISKLFTSLQIAFSQQVKVGDSVIIQEETGEVEEISLSYVVIKLWDLRRMIIPIDYLTTHGFQNLTRTTTQLLGSVLIYVDHLFPIPVLREKFETFAAESAYWDRVVCTLQVTNMQEHCLEVRGLVSAADGDNLWALRCELREKIVQFITTHYACYLPKINITDTRTAGKFN